LEKGVRSVSWNEQKTIRKWAQKRGNPKGSNEAGEVRLPFRAWGVEVNE